MTRTEPGAESRLDDVPIARLESVATEAVRAGGDRLAELFGTDTTAEFLAHDVKSAADRASEDAMLSVVRDAFPTHEIYAEESGRHGDHSRFEWIVDPLDGTNNFEAGLPTFTAAATVLSDDRPVVGAIYVPATDDTYVASVTDGVRWDGRQVSVTDSGRRLDPAAATVASVIGHDVKRDERRRDAAASIDRLVEARCKRRLESWCPTLHWALLARGRLDGIYCYHPDREEQRLGELFAAEAGLCTAASGDAYVAATTPELKARLLDCVSEGRA
ncbi:inositol monophosphatase [Halorubellus sp. JP-L1]|uniref:inositol monophosphatase family protein n=1 Tax=Halorubellus sp. JP-L1 TaxID=2715753 RepID=UPI001408CC7E|nr:inositol monophosphatase family protein [Halorubellus sp. JP-L1]NHN40887.1 inositol monophosphatase [Halorubellus sp. JP-L1]